MNILFSLKEKYFWRHPNTNTSGKTNVVNQYNDDVGCTLRRLDLKTRGRFRVARVQLRNWRIHRLFDRKYGSVKDVT